MDGVFPAKKSRFRMLSGKENAKEDISAAPAGCLKNICVSLNSVVKSHPQLSCPENTVASAAVSKDGTRQDCEYAEKCSQSTFRSVAELSLGSERISEMAVVDMDKALKGLVACEPRAFSGLAADSSEKFDNFTSISSGHFCSEFHIPGQKAPLDFTLKTNMQIVSSSSVNCGDGSGGKKQFSNAYISQSTRGLRSLLREHDVCFSMPLCRSKVE
eukprot:XP_019075516.1 PREDICTED: uncharacterized protein LOC100245124 [Vitis vinifera]